MHRPHFLYVLTAAIFGVIVLMGGYYIVRTLQPSADIRAQMEQLSPRIAVDDFEPGDVRVVILDNLPIFIWRRDAADMALAARQNDPSGWMITQSRILGQDEPVFADDANLTLNGEWFFAVARIEDNFGHVPLPRAGRFEGFFEMRHATHYDLAGRVRYQGWDNLVVVRGEMSEDGKSIVLNLRR